MRSWEAFVWHLSNNFEHIWLASVNNENDQTQTYFKLSITCLTNLVGVTSDRSNMRRLIKIGLSGLRWITIYKIAVTHNRGELNMYATYFIKKWNPTFLVNKRQAESTAE